MTRDRQASLFGTDPPEWELDAERSEAVATVVFADAPRGEFDYLIPLELRERLQPGARVRVPLGKSNRLVDAYCVSVAVKSVVKHRLKAIGRLLDDPPLVTAEVLDLAHWIAEHYVCELGTVLETVVPASVRGQAGTREQTFWYAPTSVVARLTQLKLTEKQSRIVHHLAQHREGVTTAELAAAVGCGSGPIKSLQAKRLIRCEKRRVFVGEVATRSEEPFTGWDLNDDQRQALAAITGALDQASHQTIVLHGVTGSGKTEVYIRAIEHMLGFGRQAIVLVPEISLTPQTRRRFRERWEGVAVLHSHLSPAERHGEWRRIQQGKAQVVVGAHSAVFAPVPHLGLIVIDEEHESSFKQDAVPFYHAREVAKRRAARAGVPLVLGSATPSLESWYLTQTGEYQLVSMPQRVKDRPLPVVTRVDLREEFRRAGAHGVLSQQMVVAIEKALADKGQVMLLLNRRGFSTHIQCPACGEAMKCPHCDITLTQHAEVERVICHYCDYQQPTPNRCLHCRFEGIRFGGFGTQRLEDEVQRRFPKASTLRMDTDTMRRPGSHEQALDRFRRGEVQILLGTQMIAKGLDFPQVTLVGVVNADTALHLPDFRAGERTFQLVTQVAGRTGRGDRGGEVLVQTYNPEHLAISAATRHDYETFANHELKLRKEFNYPPLSRLIRLVFRGPLEIDTRNFADSTAGLIRDLLEQRHVASRLLGPAAAPLARLRGKFRYHFLIQTEDLDNACRVVREVTGTLKAPANVQWVVDVDALSML